MSSSIFMRGDPLNLTDNFYLAYTSSSYTYIFTMNTSKYTFNQITPTAGFLQLTDQYSEYTPVSFTVVNLGNNTYSFQSGDFYLGLNSVNIIDLVSTSSTALLFTQPSENTNNIYNIQNTLYPGIPYVVQYNSTTYKWYCFTPINSTSWEYYAISYITPTPFLFPVNTGQLAIWQTNSSYPNGECFFSSTNKILGIEWLYNWTQGTSVNCDTSGTLDSTYNNCYFADLLACESMYAYNFCIGSDLCGTCMGNVSDPTVNQCRYNIQGSSIPLFASSLPITSSTTTAISLPNTTTDEAGCSKQGIALIILIAFIIFIVIVIVIIIKSNNKSNRSK